MAQYCAVLEIGSLPVASWLIGLLAKEMQDRDDPVDPGEAGCWGDALLWILRRVDDDNQEAREAVIAAGWMDKEGRWAR